MRAKLKANLRISVNQDVIDKIQGEAATNALRKTIEWLLTEITNSGKVPKLTGALELSGFVNEVSSTFMQIVWDTPYARRWYFNVPTMVRVPGTDDVVVIGPVEFRKEYNANATDHWADDWINGDKRQDVLNKFTEFYKEELGDVLK